MVLGGGIVSLWATNEGREMGRRGGGKKGNLRKNQRELQGLCEKNHFCFPYFWLICLFCFLFCFCFGSIVEEKSWKKKQKQRQKQKQKKNKNKKQKGNETPTLTFSLFFQWKENPSHYSHCQLLYSFCFCPSWGGR